MKYARMITVTAPIDKTAEVTQIYEQSILPALEPVTGFLGAYMLISPFTGEGLSLTFWATEKDAIAYENSGLYAQLVEKIRPFFTTQPILKTYQVAAETPVAAPVLR